MSLIGLVAAVGGLLIAAVLVFAVVSNRRRSGADRRRTEEATRNLYKDVDRQDRVSDPDRDGF